MKRDDLIRALVGITAAIAAGVTVFAAEPAKPATPAPATAPKPAGAPKVAMSTPKASHPSSQPVAPKPAAAAKPATPPAPKPVTPPAQKKPAEPPKPAASVPPSAPVAPGLPKGLVLHFSFDRADPKGGIADRSGQNNNGQATGPRWISSGKQGGGYEFTAPTNYIKVTNSASLNPKQATFATWFRTSRSDGVWRRIFEKGPARGYAIGIAGDTKGIPTRGKVAVTISGAGQCLSDYVVCDGSWHHAAATCDGANVKLYIDGNLQKQVAAFRGQLSENSDDLTIGLIRPNASPMDAVQSFEGALDEMMIFNRALSAEELKAMVLAVDPNAGKPMFSKGQVAGRMRQLKLLFEEGLITDEFYEAKLSECEAAGQ